MCWYRAILPARWRTDEGTVTTTILQNIQVLSAGTDIQKDAEGKPQQVQVVNLLVTPEQAQTLSLASNQLKIQLVLRNPLDTKVAAGSEHRHGQDVWQAGCAGARAGCSQGAPRAATQGVSRSTMINGSKASQEKFSSPEGKAVRAKIGNHHRMFQRIVLFLCAGQGLGLRLHRLLHPPGATFRTPLMISLWLSARPCWWIARADPRVAIGLGDIAEATASTRRDHGRTERPREKPA